jgi:ATP adenylyltransferase
MSEENNPNPHQITLKPGTLWQRMLEQTEFGLECGALQPIPTTYEFVEEKGIRFLVRILANLERKEQAKKDQNQKTAKSGKDFNPFLPYDKDLFVADISKTHLCLLNKYNVVEHHLLIITREFEEQDNPLNVRDFEAMWACLNEFESLAFYNAGTLAGASQRHKHLQIVPLPFTSEGAKIPIEPALSEVEFVDQIGKVPAFSFAHAVAKLDPSWGDSVGKAAEKTLELYHQLLREVGLFPGEELDETQPLDAYNFLATRDWMLVVPRKEEFFEGISINSLGFAGALLVKNQGQMQQLKECGPMRVLEEVVRGKAGF